MSLFKPQTKDELKKLIQNEKISLGDIDTSAITDMSELFFDISRQDFSGIDSWDTSKVTSMRLMFCGNEDFDEPIGDWDTSCVTDMGGMFYGCEKFNQSLNSWDISRVKDMEKMFYGCENFDSPLNKWHIKISVNTENMFENCNISAKNKPKKYKYAPQNKDELKKLIQDEKIYLGDIDTSAITDMSELFVKRNDWGDIIDNDRENFDGIETWDTSNVIDMEDMFRGCKNFNQSLNNWNVSKGNKYERNVLRMQKFQSIFK